MTRDLCLLTPNPKLVELHCRRRERFVMLISDCGTVPIVDVVGLSLYVNASWTK